MNTQVDQVFETPHGKYLVDPYQDWAVAEGVPIHTGAAIDLCAVETRPWARFGVDGAMCHLDGRDDFLTLFVFDLAPGAASAPSKHLYEEMFYVLAGHGTAEIEMPGGDLKTLEWGPRTLFSQPMNATMRIRNTSGERARIASVNDFRYLMSLYRSPTFLFATSLEFPERATGALSRDCAAPFAPGLLRNGEAATPVLLANGSIGADLREIAAGHYVRAQRQMFGSLLLGVSGEGMTLSWEEDPSDAVKTLWRHGVAFAPAGLQFHQHFNIGAGPARFLTIELGSVAAPMFRPRRKNYGDTEVYAACSAVIERSEQDPAIETAWKALLAGK